MWKFLSLSLSRKRKVEVSFFWRRRRRIGCINFQFSFFFFQMQRKKKGSKIVSYSCSIVTTLVFLCVFLFPCRSFSLRQYHHPSSEERKRGENSASYFYISRLFHTVKCRCNGCSQLWCRWMWKLNFCLKYAILMILRGISYSVNRTPVNKTRFLNNRT